MAVPRQETLQDVGKVGRMHICTRLCCEEPACDLAYMVRQSCFLVKCNDEKKCRVVGAETKEKKHKKTTDTSVQYIVKRKYNVQFGKGKFNYFFSIASTTSIHRKGNRNSIKPITVVLNTHLTLSNLAVGGNRSTRGKPTTFGRALTNSFHMSGLWEIPTPDLRGERRLH